MILRHRGRAPLRRRRCRTFAQLRREIIRPVGVQLSRVGLQLGATIIEVVAVLEARRTGVGFGEVQTFVVVVGQRRTVTVVDVPVEAGEVFFIDRRIGNRSAAEIVDAVDGAGDVDDLLVFGLAEAAHDRRGVRANRAAAVEVHAFEALIGAEEEQRVLDDRAAERQAVTLLFEFRHEHRAAFDRVAAHVVVGEVEEHRSRELVGARLGHHVDEAARETAVLRVERRKLDRDLRDGVERERQALRRVAVVVEAETVVEADAVDRHRVEARRGAGALHAVRARRSARRLVEIDARVVADDVLDVAVDRGALGKVFGREDRGGADRDRGSAGLRRGDHDHVAEVSAAEGEVEVGGRAEVEVNVGDLGGLLAVLRDGDVVRAANVEAANVERTARRGEHGAGEARARVLDGDRGVASGRAVFVGHRSADARARHLGKSHRRHRRRKRYDRNAASKSLEIDHVHPSATRKRRLSASLFLRADSLLAACAQ